MLRTLFALHVRYGMVLALVVLFLSPYLRSGFVNRLLMRCKFLS